MLQNIKILKIEININILKMLKIKSIKININVLEMLKKGKYIS